MKSRLVLVSLVAAVLAVVAFVLVGERGGRRAAEPPVESATDAGVAMTPAGERAAGRSAVETEVSRASEAPDVAVRAGRLLAVRIVDANDRQPIGGAEVVDGDAQVGRSGADGALDLPLTLGAFTVRATGYFPRSSSGERMREEARLSADGRAVIGLYPSGALEVVVVDGGGAPIADVQIDVTLDWDVRGAADLRPFMPHCAPRGWTAQVEASEARTRADGHTPSPRPLGGIVEAQTDRFGTLTVEGLPVGVPLRVVVSGNVMTSRHHGVVIPPETRRGTFRCTASRGYTLTGRLVREEGQAVREGTVWVRTDPVANVRGSIAGDGHFAVPGLPHGWVEVTFPCAVLEPQMVFLDSDHDLGTIVLPHAYPYRGRIASTAEPDNAAFLLFFSTKGRALRRVYSQPGGAFTVEAAPGPLEWSVHGLTSAAGAQALARGVAHLGEDRSPPDLVIDIDRAVAGLDLVFGQPGVAPGAKVDVRATMPREHRVWSDAPQLAWNMSRAAVVGEDGVARLRHVVPGTFVIDVQVRDGGSWSFGEVVLRAGEVVELATTRAAAAGPLNGVVEGAPTGAQLTVHLYDATTRRASAPVGASGEFRFDRVQSGPHAIEVRDASDDTLHVEDVEVTATRDRVRIVLAERATVRGRVQPFRTGGEFTIARRGSTDQPMLVRTVPLDVAGGFEVTNLPAGRYFAAVVVTAEGDRRWRVRRLLDLVAGEDREWTVSGPAAECVVEFHGPAGPFERLAVAELRAARDDGGVLVVALERVDDTRFRAPSFSGRGVVWLRPGPGGFGRGVDQVQGQHWYVPIADGLPEGGNKALHVSSAAIRVDFESERLREMWPRATVLALPGVPSDVARHLVANTSILVVDQGERWIEFAPVEPGATIILEDPFAKGIVERHVVPSGGLRVRLP